MRYRWQYTRGTPEVVLVDDKGKNKLRLVLFFSRETRTKTRTVFRVIVAWGRTQARLDFDTFEAAWRGCRSLLQGLA